MVFSVGNEQKLLGKEQNSNPNPNGPLTNNLLKLN